jgi:hypothetical protein
VNWDWSGNPDPAAMRAQLAGVFAGTGMAPPVITDPSPAPAEPGWDWSGDPDHTAMMTRLTGEPPPVGIGLLDVTPAGQPTTPGWDWSGYPDPVAMFAALTVLLTPAGVANPLLLLIAGGYLVAPGPGRANAAAATTSATALDATVTLTGAVTASAQPATATGSAAATASVRTAAQPAAGLAAATAATVSTGTSATANAGVATATGTATATGKAAAASAAPAVAAGVALSAGTSAGGAGSPPFLAGSAIVTGTGGSRSATVSNATAGGDTLLVIVAVNNTTCTVSSVTDSAGNIYTADGNFTTTQPTLYRYRSPGATGGSGGGATGALATSNTFTVSTAALSGNVEIVAVDVPGPGAVDQNTAVSTGSSTTPSVSATPGFDFERCVACFATANAGGAPTVNSPFTSLVSLSSGSNPFDTATYQVLGTGTSGVAQTSTLTIVSANWRAAMWTFR